MSNKNGYSLLSEQNADSPSQKEYSSTDSRRNSTSSFSSSSNLNIRKFTVDQIQNQDQDQNQNHHGKAGISGSVFNLTNTIIGGGILSLPYAFHLSGIGLGLFFMVMIYFLSICSMYLLLECSTVLGVELTYHSLAERSHGMVGIIATDVAMILSCFGVMCSYLVIIYDMLSPLIGDFPRQVVIVISAILLIPLSSLKKLNIYKFVSFFAIISIFYLVFLVIFRSIQGLVAGSWNSNCEKNGCASFANFDLTFFRTIPIFSFAFTCQMNFYTIYSELEYSTPKRMKTVIWSSLTICLLVYSSVGIFGYLDFYDDVKGNILLNYNPDDVLAGIARVGVAIVITFSYPLMCHPCVNTIRDLLFSSREFSTFRRVLTVTILTSLAALIAIFVKDVSLIFGLTGSTASSAICFIFPALFYFSIHPSKWTEPGKLVSIFLFICGSIFLVASTVVTLLDMFDNSDDFNVTSIPWELQQNKK